MENGSFEIVPGVTVTPDQPAPARSFGQRLRWIGLETVAVLFWLYAITKLFVFDVDVYLLDLLAPKWAWLLNYKFPILLGLIVVGMVVSRSLTLGLTVLFIVLYPLIVLFWKIPLFVWKQKNWLLAFAIVNAAISFFYSFKRDFIAGTLFLICTILIVTVDNQYALFGASFLLLIIVAFAYYAAFRKAFKPSAVFETYTKIFPAVWTSIKVDGSLRNLPIGSMTAQQIELRTNSLQNVVLFNRACLIISKKLRNYQRSGVNVISYVFGLVFLLIVTIFAFGLINYAIFKIDPSLYQFTYSHPSLFAFIYYSAGSMFYTANGLVPVATVSQAIQLVQFLCGVLLIVIFVTVLVALRNEKYSQELENVISSVEREGYAAERVLRSEFNFDSIDAAIAALQQAKAGFVAFIIYLTNNLGE